MQNINFSKRVYEKDVFLGCVHILKKMNSKVSKDGSYRIDTDKPITPEIPALLLKMGFEISIFLSEDNEIMSSLFIFGKGYEEGRIRTIGNEGLLNKETTEKYHKKVKEYMNSEECEDVLKRVERSFGLG